MWRRRLLCSRWYDEVHAFLEKQFPWPIVLITLICDLGENHSIQFERELEWPWPVPISKLNGFLLVGDDVLLLDDQETIHACGLDGAPLAQHYGKVLSGCHYRMSQSLTQVSPSTVAFINRHLKSSLVTLNMQTHSTHQDGIRLKYHLFNTMTACCLFQEYLVVSRHGKYGQPAYLEFYRFDPATLEEKFEKSILLTLNLVPYLLLPHNSSLFVVCCVEEPPLYDNTHKYIVHLQEGVKQYGPFQQWITAITPGNSETELFIGSAEGIQTFDIASNSTVRFPSRLEVQYMQRLPHLLVVVTQQREVIYFS